MLVACQTYIKSMKKLIITKVLNLNIKLETKNHVINLVKVILKINTII